MCVPLFSPIPSNVDGSNVSTTEPGTGVDIRDARTLFPATAASACFNTAAVGSAGQTLTAAYHCHVDERSVSGLDDVRESCHQGLRVASGGDDGETYLLPVLDELLRKGQEHRDLDIPIE